jgi:hypothetical protein
MVMVELLFREYPVGMHDPVDMIDAGEVFHDPFSNIGRLSQIVDPA